MTLNIIRDKKGMAKLEKGLTECQSLFVYLIKGRIPV